MLITNANIHFHVLTYCICVTGKKQVSISRSRNMHLGANKAGYQ